MKDEDDLTEANTTVDPGQAGEIVLPQAATMTFEQWKQIPSGLLNSEAEVSEYVVAPLERFLFTEWEFTRAPFTLEAEYRAPSGCVDFVVCWGTLHL